MASCFFVFIFLSCPSQTLGRVSLVEGRERTGGCWRMKNKFRYEILLTLETGAAIELQQSSSSATTAATDLKLKHTYLIYTVHT